MIVKVFEGPSQVTPPFVKEGVTTSVTTTGEEPLFTAANAAIILVVPLGASPIDGVSFVHE